MAIMSYETANLMGKPSTSAARDDELCRKKLLLPTLLKCLSFLAQLAESTVICLLNSVLSEQRYGYRF
jgi:hypothetical protein